MYDFIITKHCYLVNWPVTKNCRSLISASIIACRLSLLSPNSFSLDFVEEALEDSAALAGCKRSAMAVASEPSACRLSITVALRALSDVKAHVKPKLCVDSENCREHCGSAELFDKAWTDIGFAKNASDDCTKKANDRRSNTDFAI